MRIHRLALISLLLIPFLFASAQNKVEKTGALTEASVPAAVRNALESAGYRVLRGDGSPLAEIWFRKGVPAAAQKGAGDVLYPELATSVMVGVISFPSGAKDFRGQPIKPGFYTMRYELLPNDGNHLGVAPNRDFLLLAPAGADADPAAKYDFEQLVKLSKQAAGSNHPAVFSLVLPTLSAPGGADKGGPPTVFQNADGYMVFAASLTTDSGKTMPIAMVVKGEAAQ